MSSEIDSPLTNEWLDADHAIAAYRNNPLIGSLGPIMTRSQVLASLTRRPA